MTAKLFNLAAERSKRTKPPPAERYHITMLEHHDHWAFQITFDDTEEEWHSERPYVSENDAWSEALLAVGQVRRDRRQARVPAV